MGGLWGKPELKILLCGPASAGKTTMLYYLKKGDVGTTIPTLGFNVEDIEINNVKMVTFDVGMGSKTKKSRRHYFLGTHGLVFVIDSNDVSKFTEAKDDLDLILKEQILKDCPILFVANKQDLDNSKSIEEISEVLDLQRLDNLRKWFIIPAVATQGTGLKYGLEWMAETLTTNSTPADKHELLPEQPRSPIYTIDGAHKKNNGVSEEDSAPEENESLYRTNGDGKRQEIQNSNTWNYITCGFGSRAKEWLWGSKNFEAVNDNFE